MPSFPSYRLFLSLLLSFSFSHTLTLASSVQQLSQKTDPCLSGSAQQGLLAVEEKFDLVKLSEEKGGQERPSGQTELIQDISLTRGTQELGRGTKELGPRLDVTLTVGSNEGAVNERNGADGH